MADSRALREQLVAAVDVVARLSKKCDKSKGLPLDKISVVMIGKKMKAFEAAVQQAQVACQALQSLKEEVDDISDDLDSMEQETTDQFNHLLHRGTACTYIRTIQLMLTTVEQEVESNGYRAILLDEIKSIGEAMGSMNIMRSQPGAVTCKELQELALDVTRRYREIQVLQGKEEIPEVKAASTPPCSHHNNQGLPLVIPTFDGQTLSWKRWWNTFSAIMKENSHLTEYSQRCHLLTAMGTTEAQEFALKTFELEPTHAQAIAEIRAKYEDHRTLHRHYHRQYFIDGTVESSRKSLEAFSDKFRATYKAFKDAKVDTAGQVMIMHALLQFNPTLLTQWKKSNKKRKFTPTYEVMSEFLREQLECLGEEEATTQAATGYKKARPKSATAATALQARPEGQTSTCCLCQESHFVAFCPQYEAKSLVDRIQFVRDSNLCFNCLGSTHVVSDCRNQKRCKKCRRKHHTSIHEQRGEHDDSEEEVDAQTNRVETHPGNIPPRLIKTALVCVRAQGLEQKSRAQFDSGATVSLITTRLAKTLKAPVVPRSAARLAGINGANQPLISKHRVRVTLRGTRGEEIDICPQVIDSIAPTPCRLDLKKVRHLPFLRDLTLADPTYSSLARIDLLIDVEASNACHTETVISGPTPGLKAHQTIFGWTLSGGDTLGFWDEDVEVALRAQPLDDPIQVFRDLLNLEEEGVDENFSRDELEALRDFSERVQRDEHGRYSVGCPHRRPKIPLGKSRESALRRFLSLERSLTAKGEWEEFSAAILDYFESGHSEEVPPEDLRKPVSETYYLPMHGVRKETSTSTKLRVVFDASAKSSTGNSLNDALLPGPALHALLTSVMTLFRSFEIGFSADISRMFRGIGLHQAERDYHRYFQRGCDGLLKEMRHTRLVFGVTCSPFLANQVIRQIGIDHGEEYPLAAALIKSNYYVDDCLAGANTVDEAYEAVTQSIQMMKRACFDLKKWRSNSRELLDRLPSELCEASDLAIPTAPAECSRALGIHWDPRSDVLYIATPTMDLELVATRREVARAIAKIYDLLGFFSPYILQARVVLQATWDLAPHWDAELPESLQTTWREWLLGLTRIAHHPIPRYMGKKGKQVYSIQLHGFADASFSALGGVVYARYFHHDLDVHIGFVASRMRVVPRKKRPTIPRLELCAALVLSQLMSRIQEQLKVSPDATYYWSDSTVVLGWLRRRPGELKTFVANRVEKIQQLTPVPSWRYVKSSDNPADILSRGISAQELVQSQLWWEGPPWLARQPDAWPCGSANVHKEDLPDIKGVIQIVSNADEEFGRECSTFEELVRSVALMTRFLRPDARRPLYITVLEYLQARQRVLRRSQEFWYPQEYQLLKAKRFLPSENSLSNLNPFLDDQGVMRVGGRLQKAGLHPAVAHPVILNVKSHVVQLFITHYHHLLHHAGSSTVMSTMAVHYYIPSIGRFLRTLSKRCVPCRTFSAQLGKQQMGELPETRVTVSRPFSVIGMDFAGPFMIKRGRIRDPSKLKAYVCLFLCYVTRAVHLELVSEMTTQAFLAAFTRFVAIRGAPTRIETDNGSNFIGAEAEIREVREALLHAADWDTVERWSATRGITWKFIPVRSPQSGGYWEAAVGSMKTTLCKLMKPHLLDFEEFSTVLAETSAILNSRPLVSMDAPADDAIEPLTPGHFLVGTPLTAVPFRHEEGTPIHLLRRWNLVKRLQHDLWERWKEEYLTTLQRRGKDKRPSPSFKKGDVVLEKNLDTFQRKWPIAVVVRAKPGTDNLVRIVDIRRSNGKVVSRGVRYLVHLFSESAGSDSDGGECSGQEG